MTEYCLRNLRCANLLISVYDVPADIFKHIDTITASAASTTNSEDVKHAAPRWYRGSRALVAESSTGEAAWLRGMVKQFLYLANSRASCSSLSIVQNSPLATRRLSISRRLPASVKESRSIQSLIVLLL